MAEGMLLRVQVSWEHQAHRRIARTSSSGGTL